MGEVRAVLSECAGYLKTDEGPVVFKFTSSEGEINVALPIEQVHALMASAIACLPPALTASGQPAGPGLVSAMPVKWMSWSFTTDGSMVLALKPPSGGQIAFYITPEQREALEQGLQGKGDSNRQPPGASPN
jgi:hypothetical protein